MPQLSNELTEEAMSEVKPGLFSQTFVEESAAPPEIPQLFVL
jgi:hypothetical protein